MHILSFDTTSGALSVCLMQNGSLVLEETIEKNASDRQDAAANLMPAIAGAIANAKWQRSQIDLLVVGVGPGTFTSVRASVVTARTLAQALNLPVIGISRLECIGSYFNGKIAVILSVSDTTYFAAAFEFIPGKNHSVLVNPCYLPVADLSEKFACSELWVLDEKAQKSVELQNYNWASAPVVKNMATVQAQIAWNRLSLTEPELLNKRKMLADIFPWSQIEPLYLREPSITVKKPYADSNKKNDVS